MQCLRVEYHPWNIPQVIGLYIFSMQVCIPKKCVKLCMASEWYTVKYIMSHKKIQEASEIFHGIV